MIDHRLLLVLMTSLVVTSCAEIGGLPSGTSEVQSKDADAMELKDLLRAVKHYLDIKEAEKDAPPPEPVRPRPPPTANQDIRTVYATGTTAEDLTNAVASGTGYWTRWLDVDNEQSVGIGEYEDCSAVKYKQNLDGRCYLGCKNPVAASYAASKKDTKATWADIENCIGPIDTKRVSACGFSCRDNDAKDFPKTAACDTSKCLDYGLGEACNLCPDVRVQYFCMGTAPSEDRCCPYSSRCTSPLKDLKEALREMENVDSRNDVIASILNDINDVLEEPSAALQKDPPSIMKDPPSENKDQPSVPLVKDPPSENKDQPGVKDPPSENRDPPSLAKDPPSVASSPNHQ